MLGRLSQTLREIHRLSREASLETFQDDAFEAMKEVIQFEYGYWGGGRLPLEAVVMHYNFLHKLPADEMSAAFEAVKSRPDHIRSLARCVTNAGRAQVIEPRKEGTDDLYSAYGINQIVTLYQHDDNLGLYHVVSLYRRGEMPFTEQERLLFENVVPHLQDAFRESRLTHLSGSSQNVCSRTSAAALVDREGAVHFVRPAFVELMRCEWPGWRGPYLPEVMRPMRETPFAGEEVAVEFIRQNCDLYLALLRRKGCLDQLTKREMEVANLFAQGLSHKEVAARLSIAPTTARNYIARLHNKLGTSKVSQIATLLVKEGRL